MPSQKILEAKKKEVSEFVSEFEKAISFVFADARGLTVLEDTELRSNLRKNNVKYQVIKNTTSRFVFQQLKVEGLEEVLKGPTAIAYSTEDVVLPAKVIQEHADKFPNLEIKSGIMEGKVISTDEVKELAKIPGKEVLYTQIACGLNSPITKLAMLLDALRVKLEEGGEISPSTEEDKVSAAEEKPAEQAPAAETPVAEAAPADGEAPAPAVEEAAPAAEEAPAVE